MKLQPRSLSFILFMTLLFGMVTFSSVALADSQQQQAQFVAPRLVVNSSFLNVRSGPGIQYSVLLTVVGGTELPVLGRANDNVWFQVSTVVGVGWVNVQFTVPRGSFENVPVISSQDIAAIIPPVGGPLTLELGQGGGVELPAFSTSAVPSTTGVLRFTISDNRVVIVHAGERYRAVINVEAVNLRTQPADGAPALGTLFRNDAIDFSIVGDSKDKAGVQWFALDVPDLGVGWVEAPKVVVRLSRAAGQVMIVVANTVGMTDTPSGNGNNLPVLTSGQEGFLTNISPDGKFVQLELGGGTRGWVPFDSVVGRTGTVTDEIDFSQVIQTPSVAAPVAGTTTTSVSQPLAAYGLDTPHIVVNTGFLNVRSGPGAQFSSVATVPGGTELAVIGIAKDRVWYLVLGAFGRGWVNSDFVVFRGSIDVVPIIQNADAVIGTLSTPVAVVAGSVTVFAAPGTNFGSIGALNGPIEVNVVARTVDSKWLQLDTSFGFGWVLADQVLVRGDVSQAPVVG